MTYIPPTLEESGSQGIAVLRDRHRGETAYLIGKGPSLANLCADMIGPGPVITLNQAVLVVQTLGLPNRVYAMQLDGMETEDPDTIPRPCDTCHLVGWKRPPVVDPYPGIATVFLRHFSSWCLHGRPNRYVIDKEFYPEPSTPSVLQAIGLARWMGAGSIVMVAFDHLATGDAGYFDEAAYPPETIARMRRNLELTRPFALDALDRFGPYSFMQPPRRGAEQTLRIEEAA